MPVLSWSITSGTKPKFTPIIGVSAVIDSITTSPKGSRHLMGKRVIAALPKNSAFCVWLIRLNIQFVFHLYG